MSDHFDPLKGTDITKLSRGQLRGLAKDMAAAKKYHGRRVVVYAEAVKTLNIEFSRRVTPPDIEVTDHAVVRYLERVKGLDVEAIRAEIAQHVKPENGEELFAAGDCYIVAARQGRVQTVLTADMWVDEADDAA